MRPFTSTIPFAEALRLVLEAAVPIEDVEPVQVGEADGRVVARDVVAEVDAPPFDRAAMDGYAVVAADTTNPPVTLACVGRIFTGEMPARALGRGECMEIATGAPLPAGADAVVMVEETERADANGGQVRFRAMVRAGQNIGRRGADIRTGQTVVSAGQLLTPSRVGAIAAIGAAAIDVYRRPSVAILPTGNEIVAPGQPLLPGQVYDINRYTLSAVVQRHGGVPVALPAVADSLEGLSRAADVARAHDVIVFSGGSSVGDRDLIVDLLRKEGEIVFHGVAVKPGKPTGFGRIGRTPVLAMPGYPTSCLSNAYMLLVPYLRRVARLPAWQSRRMELPLGRRIESTSGRHQFYTVRIEAGRAQPAFKASGDITSMAHADGYIEIPADTGTLETGTLVTVTLFD